MYVEIIQSHMMFPKTFQKRVRKNHRLNRNIEIILVRYVELIMILIMHKGLSNQTIHR